METKIKQVLTHLQSGRSITAMQSVELFRYYRLSHGIYKLRSQGHNISTTMFGTKGKDAYGVYTLIKPIK